MYMFNYVYLYTGTFFSEIFLILREKSNPIVDGKTNPANPVAGKVVYQFIPLFPGFFFLYIQNGGEPPWDFWTTVDGRNPAPPGMYKTL